MIEPIDQEPPASVHAEQCVLGSVLMVPELLDDVAMILRESDFYSHANGRIYHHMLALSAAGQVPDSTLLIETLKRARELDAVGGMNYLVDIADAVSTPAVAMDLARIVRSKAVMRRLLLAGSEIQQLANDPSQDAREAVGQAETLVLGLLDDRAETATVTVGEAAAEAHEWINARLDRGEGLSGLPTGFEDLDRMTGGFHPGQLVILAARPGVGKSALASNICEHLAVGAGNCTLFVSLEMSRTELAERLMCSISKVNGHRLRNGYATPLDRGRLAMAKDRLTAAPLHLDDAPGRTVTEIGSIARRMKRDGLRLIVVDYLQLITPDSPRDPRQEQVAKIARRLKGLARELKVPILCLAQLNRQSTEKAEAPKLSHLRESGAIEQDADVVLLIHRPDAGEPELIIAKQRSGPTGTVNLIWEADYAQFRSKPLGKQCETPEDFIGDLGW